MIHKQIKKRFLDLFIDHIGVWATQTG